MNKIVFLLLASVLLLAACAPAPTPTSTRTPHPAPSPTQETPTPAAVTREDLGLKKGTPEYHSFRGIEKNVTAEADGRYSVTVDGKKYFLSLDTFDLHADLNNAYAPATVNAVDVNNNPVTLIYNKEGLSLNAPLSLDIESPTDFDDSSRLTTLQKYLLQHADPFAERSKGLAIQAEWSENGKAYYLRTDYFGNQSKPSAVWLRYTAPNGNIYYINPTDINDLNGRKVIMCAYGENAIKDKFQRGYLDLVIHLDKIGVSPHVFWPILKADDSFFTNFLLDPNIPGTDYSDLAYLLSLDGNKPDEIKYFGDLIDFIERDYPVSNSNQAVEWISTVPIDSQIQEVIIPCAIK